MKYLIDTCTFIWLSTDPDKLSGTARKIIQSADNMIIVSTVSPWELALKKDDIIQTDDLESFVKQACIRHQLTLTSPSLSHVCMVKKLPFHHKDPFDRLLIATSVVENIPLISADRKIALYAINTIW
ncbi:MAG: type II toxin-antitoxin system VapC family toxin [Pseudomonadota bacterium]|nr:type II toxin-antitoxin system VapC family toxin [Pseudomonadota bacterium]